VVTNKLFSVLEQAAHIDIQHTLMHVEVGSYAMAGAVTIVQSLAPNGSVAEERNQ
jgi:hypothetical protein